MPDERKPEIWEIETIVRLAEAARSWPLDRGPNPRRKEDPSWRDDGHIMREYAIPICLAAMGVRPAEWEPISFMDLCLRCGDLRLYGTPKKPWLKRAIQIPPELLEVMEAAYPADDWGVPCNLLVRPDAVTRYMHGEVSRRRLKYITERSNIPWDLITWQSLNAGFEERLERAGVPRDEISELVGRQSKTKDRKGQTEGGAQ